ncbi:ATP-grasp domain-containing protein [Aquibacillus sp. 3ASR75-11]|uniref:ATP-grasp domain-containing protein n=1 Tax=Terrihalobacillus insolitus TaxID=2950438 RepID=A0A9X3WXX7_9BACI|nr:ATP-grasp domain-containing protein [Terrihalobacillus insolitus]MDC3412994.1 ATP-grasp domain-containing protein [Terrihalobacillus insolitus]MDC3426301.1 ATP-grasp domain-containing protein [Terrihalobacillus insolitus]
MKKPHILIIGGWDEILTKALRLSVDITLFQTNDSITEYQKNVVKSLYIMDINSCEETLKNAIPVNEKHPFDSVVSFTEYGLESAAFIKEKLNLLGNPLKPISLTRDKVEMREFLKYKETKIKTIGFAECFNLNDLEHASRNLNYPLIIKPSKGAGSEGVVYINSPNELIEAWTWASKYDSPLILEEFIDGDEFSIESISFNGIHTVIAITKKQTTGAPNFIEVGHVLPAPIENEKKLLIEEAVIDFLQAIGHKIGPCHTEVKINSQGIFIIEAQTRVGGDRIWEMVELAKGYDLITETLRYLVFGATNRVTSKSNTSEILFFLSPVNAGENAIKTLEELNGVVKIKVTGQNSQRIESSRNRLGYILTVGKSEEDTRSVIKTVQEKLFVKDLN